MNADTSQNSRLSLNTIFSRMAGQLDILGRHLNELEISAQMSKSEPEVGQHARMKALQNFDTMRQSIDDLTLLSSELGNRKCNTDLPHDECHNLALGLQLERSRTLLSACKIDMDARGQAVIAGEPVFFLTPSITKRI